MDYCCHFFCNQINVIPLHNISYYPTLFMPSLSYFCPAVLSHSRSYNPTSLQGVTCFDYSRSLNLVVTGGLDPAVRLWNRFVTVRPVGTLLGHRTTVVDVAIYLPLRQILSYSKDAVGISNKTTSEAKFLDYRTIPVQRYP